MDIVSLGVIVLFSGLAGGFLSSIKGYFDHKKEDPKTTFSGSLFGSAIIVSTLAGLAIGVGAIAAIPEIVDNPLGQLYLVVSTLLSAAGVQRVARGS